MINIKKIIDGLYFKTVLKFNFQNFAVTENHEGKVAPCIINGLLNLENN